MKKTMTFKGVSGAGYDFIEKPVESNWVYKAGVAVFAARDTYGWRVIKIVELSGRDHDVRPIWAFHDAQRFGADTVFVCEEDVSAIRRGAIDDMVAGLDPAAAPQEPVLAMAA